MPAEPELGAPIHVEELPLIKAAGTAGSQAQGTGTL
jgi:hypothetical protein